MKKIILFLLIFTFTFINVYAEQTYQLSTHILDISKGTPAPNIDIWLYKLGSDGKTWNLISKGVTNKNGRIANFLPGNNNDGTYKLQFFTYNYFKSQGLDSIYPYVDLVFKISGKNHYHIPITMSANGYATYRGN